MTRQKRLRGRPVDRWLICSDRNVMRNLKPGERFSVRHVTSFRLISQALEEQQQNNEYELQQLKTELIEKHEKEMQELQTELEENHNNDLATARKSAMESRANFTMSMDSLDVEVWSQYRDLLKKNVNICSYPRTKRNSSTFFFMFHA